MPGDGGPATSARLVFVNGLAADSVGNLYIADSGLNSIRKVDSNGIITTVAGNGVFGNTGDGGLASNAALAGPAFVATGPGGGLYIASVVDNRIRKVSNGVITTIVGAGNPAGQALGNPLNLPTDIAVDLNGNIYIAEPLGNRVRKVSNGVISVLAGTGTSGFSGDGGPAASATLAAPSKLAVDVQGNVFILDSGNARVRKVDTTGTITTVAGNGNFGDSGDNGPATSAGLGFAGFILSGASEYSLPGGIAVDHADVLYILTYVKVDS